MIKLGKYYCDCKPLTKNFRRSCTGIKIYGIYKLILDPCLIHAKTKRGLMHRFYTVYQARLDMIMDSLNQQDLELKILRMQKFAKNVRPISACTDCIGRYIERTYIVLPYIKNI